MPSTARSRTPHLKAQARLLIAVVVGVAAGTLSDHGLDLATRLLLGWNLGVCTLLVLIWYMMMTANEAQLQRKIAEEDEPRTIILAVMLAAVLASLGGIVAEVQVAKAAHGTLAVLATSLSISTVILSWLCMHTLFAIHYAHEFYGDRGKTNADERGLEFPTAAKLGYTEFVYLAFCVGMTYQVSDMMARSRKFRWLVTVHACLSFFYNTFILALAVNFVSGLGQHG